MPLAVPYVPTTLETNLASVRARIAAAAARAGRPEGAVRLVAVTKNVGTALAKRLCAAGAADLGENRAQELERKTAAFTRAGVGARWHFLGHLQRNKARSVAAHADVLHSLDSLRLAEALAQACAELGRRLDVHLQVMVHPEPTKSGFAPHEVERALDAVRALPALRVVGLMAMAPLASSGVEKERLARATFERTAELARGLHAHFEVAPLLSMGMSDDFETAIECGSDLVRVGSALFAGLDGALDAEIDPEERA